MERKISLSDLRKAVDEAYELVKSIKEGEIDPRNTGARENQMGISVVLADGTTINKGDTDVKVPMGSIVRVPLASVMFSQNSRDELIKKSGQCPCHKKPHKPAHLPVSAHTIRAFSAMEPTGDPESKWNIYENRMIDLMGTSPELNIPVYNALKKQVEDDDTVNRLAGDGYYLYDDAVMAVDLATKAEAMNASTAQLAMMGATIAADGVAFFQNMLIGDLRGSYGKLLVAPVSLKQTLLRLIDGEIARGRIILKTNAVTERELIDKLAEASQAGVRVDLIVRGICCLVPGVPGKTDHITVTSIVGEFLEHSRIYCFGEGALRQMYLSSADIMTRNQERRGVVRGGARWRAGRCRTSSRTIWPGFWETM